MPEQFSIDFPGGNGLLLEHEEGRRGVIRFAAEPKNCPEAMWFHWRLAGASGPVRCVLANPEQTLGGPDWSSNRIVFRRDQEAWRRSGPPQRIEGPDGRVEWAWDLDAGAGDLEVAWCFPYQVADLQRTLKDCRGVFRESFLGVTQHNRRLTRLHTSLPAPGRPAVVLVARQHAGETPGSWVLDGLLRHVAARQALQRRVAWWVVPLVNLDDVVEGSYGKDPWPYDCNRAWGPGAARRPEVGAIVSDILRLRQHGPVGFLCDLHSPSHSETAVYVPLRGWDSESVISPTAQAFAEKLHAAMPAEIRSPIAHRTPPMDSVTRHTGLTATRWAAQVLATDAACLETSYLGNGKVYYTIDHYRQIGAVLADTLADWVAAK